MTSECRLCSSLGATTLEKVNSHTEIHARQLDLIDCSDDSVDGKLSIQNGSHPEIRTKRKEMSKESALFRYCRELISIYGKDCGIKCSQCKRSIQSGQNSSQTSNSLLNHACVHLNKDLFACSHCDLKFISKAGLCIHLYKIHKLSTKIPNYVDMMEDHQSDIMDMLKLCFGKSHQKQLNVTAFGKQKRNYVYQGTQDPLFTLAYECVGKHQRGDQIECNLCSSSIPNQYRQNAAISLLDHARSHVDKPIFTCRLCQFTASTVATIRSHLKRIHSAAQSKQNFKDGSSECVEEISSMLEDCFGDKKKEIPPGIRKKEKPRLWIMSRMHGNNLKAARHIRASEVIRIHAKDGKVICRICSHSASVSEKAGSRFLFSHAIGHLDKRYWPYRCKLCPNIYFQRSSVREHLKIVHKSKDAGEFEDLSDKFHSEIMEIMSKCYEDSEPGGMS